MSGDVSNEEQHIDFQVSATLRKWPSLNNQRREDQNPYIVMEGTLDTCIREFMAKPESSRGLYDIRTTHQLPLVPPIVNADQILELARFRDFL